MISFRKPAKFDKQATVILLTKEQLAKSNYSFVNKELVENINLLKANKQFEADCQQFFPLFIHKKLYLLVGVKKETDSHLTSLRIAVRKAFLSSYALQCQSIEVIPHTDNEPEIKAIIEGVLLGTYSWSKYKSSEKDKKVSLKEVSIVAVSKPSYQNTVIICDGVKLTRDLINDNADFITSDYLEKTIRELIKGQSNIKIEVLNKKEMQKLGLGLHLAVNQGSKKEPKLIIVKYTGAAATEGYTALLGKGITFDTGGLNLKPTGSMETMRCDMSGAAAVIGTLKNAINLKLKKNIIFATTIAENVIGPRAFKPGDVIRGYSGKTVEVLNTDAEGRLVLGDAISYLVKNYKPARIIDIATLTGACVVALAHDYTGLVTTDDKLARELVHASNETDDRVWRMPSYPEIKEAVKSQIADIKNVGYPKGAGGTITAAEFLRQFTEGTTWAHLDIAGTSYVDGACRWYYGHGATGAGVRLLTYYLQNIDVSTNK